MTTETKTSVLASNGDLYKIKDMERPKEVVTTPHGKFKIITYDKRDVNHDVCEFCFYKGNKTKGAPCVEGTWCGSLYSYLIPINLNKDGRAIDKSRVRKVSF